MASYNKVILMGNLTRDPELKFTQTQTAVCNFGIAINESYTNAQGEQQENVTFVDCEAWGRTAEVINEHLSKGSPLLVDGSLRLDQWIDTMTGQKRSRLKVRVWNVQFIGTRDAADAEAPPAAEDAPPAPTDDDIAF